MANPTAFQTGALPPLRTNWDQVSEWLKAGDNLLEDLHKRLDEAPDALGSGNMPDFDTDNDSDKVADLALKIENMGKKLRELQKESNEHVENIDAPRQSLRQVMDKVPNFISQNVGLNSAATQDLLTHFLEAFKTLDPIRELSPSHKTALFNAEVQLLQEKLSMLKTQTTARPDDLEECQHTSQESQRSLIKLREELKVKQDKIRSLEQDLEQSNSTVDDTKARCDKKIQLLKDSNKKNEEDMQTWFNEKTAEVEKWSLAIQDYEKEKKDNVQKIKDLETEVAMKQQTLDRLSQKTSQAGHVHGVDVEVLQSEKATLEDELYSLRLQNKASEQEAEMLGSQIQTLEQEKMVAIQAHQNVNRLLQKEVEDRKSWTDEIGLLKLQLEDEKTAHSEARDGEIQALDAFNQGLEARQELENAKKLEEVQKVHAQRDLDVLRSEIESLRKSHGQLLEEKNKSQEDLVNMTRQRDEIVTERDGFEKDLENMTRQYEEANEQSKRYSNLYRNVSKEKEHLEG
ncbi:hypothetical protein PFICI_09977 [Pestalotiopsis fici W106-1]|uniref:Uncharacterized protein n=1 Tax=Pestalotiopsis fici (strain W106-1 / CGMCC3.15140) TaxID=1229662 RepID=W3WVN8_PESFW|nr:uncharacterized protein PFICI_09977 [Pestalotiopsis fici W106-1]ETS77915.1 hypothetical protein PFICI_09977 [Pestalotiopsis fici W106-1]